MGYEQALRIRSNFVNDSVVFSEHKLKLVVIHLEFVLLEEYNFGGLRNVNSDSGQALRFSDQGQNLAVEVHVQLVVVGVSDDERRLQPRLRLFDLVRPLLAPQVLERKQDVADLVVHFDELLRVPLLDQVLGELLHGAGNSVEQVSAPGDRPGDGGQVSDDGRVVAVLLVLVLDFVDLLAVVVEEDGVLALERVLEVVALEDGLELFEQLERVLDAGDHLEVLVDVLLQLGLDGGHVYVELHEVPVEGVHVVLEQLVVLLLEAGDVAVESGQDVSDSLQVVLF